MSVEKNEEFSFLDKKTSQFTDLTIPANSSAIVHKDKRSEIQENIYLKRLEREEKIRAYNDWLRFFTTKAAGVSTIVVGSLELILPSLLPLVLPPPLSPIVLVGIGFSFLTGDQPILLLKHVLNSLPTEEKDTSS